MAARYFGVTKNIDLDPSLIKPDVRPFTYKVHDFVCKYGDIPLLLMSLFVFLLPFVNYTVDAGDYSGLYYSFTDFLFPIAVFWYLFARNKKKTFQFRKPIDTENPDDWGDTTGLFYLGNDRVENTAIWFGKSDISTHMLVFGSTGSGKSRFLLGILYQSILIGSGCCYVDGKGDNTVFWLVYSFCRRIGREDDLLVMNYLTGGDEREENNPFNHRLSNTNNPMAYGTADTLNSLIVGLMRDAGGDGAMWKGRARTMLKGLLNALVYKRDHENLTLDIMKVREYFPLDEVFKLSRDPNLKASAKDPLKKYLLDLPGFSEDQALLGDINAKAFEQHNYLTMQLTEVMSDLSETYGHIFGVPQGEVDFVDVVFNRRILFVLLPALEKDPDALAGLGKLVVAGIRSALAPALGEKLEGTKKEVIDTKPTKSKVPFVIILDEYGYYAVPGFAIVAAQARSLGVAVIFAGQDYPSFQKASKEEAASTVANTNIKICMKLEDPEDTFKVIEARGGEADVANSQGQEMKNGSSYVDQKSTRIESKKRINLRDLVDQNPGQAHVIFGDEISRCNFFFYDPFEAVEAELNKFLMILPPTKVIISKINGSHEKLVSLFEQRSTSSAKTPLDMGVSALFKDFGLAKKFNEDSTESSLYAIGMIEIRDKLKDIELKKEVMLSAEPVTENISTEVAENSSISLDKYDDVESHVKEDLIGQIKDELNKVKDESSNKLPSEIEAFMSSFDELDEDNILEVMSEELKDSYSGKAEEISKSFSDILSESVSINLEKMGVDNPENHTPSKQLDEDEDEESGSIEVLGESSIYPTRPVPPRINKDELNNKTSTLMDVLGRLSN
jgi:intracellular multiplication protein IcmO